MTVIIEKFDTKENGVEMSSLRYCTVYHFLIFFSKLNWTRTRQRLDIRDKRPRKIEDTSINK